jgi:hypothetical protein
VVMGVDAHVGNRSSRWPATHQELLLVVTEGDDDVGRPS